MNLDLAPLNGLMHFLLILAFADWWSSWKRNPSLLIFVFRTLVVWSAIGLVFEELGHVDTGWRLYADIIGVVGLIWVGVANTIRAFRLSRDSNQTISSASNISGSAK